MSVKDCESFNYIGSKYFPSGEKNFECSECHKKFRENNTLKRHMRTHSKVKSYLCEVHFTLNSNFGANKIVFPHQCLI